MVKNAVVRKMLLVLLYHYDTHLYHKCQLSKISLIYSINYTSHNESIFSIWGTILYQLPKNQ
jgi:hypothetical protein